jgi:hypothetical protein
MYVVVLELNTWGRAFVRLWITPTPPVDNSGSLWITL